jgi:hypothetical protein
LYGGSAIATLGAVEVPVVCGQRRVATFPFVVVELGSNIMGKNLFNQLGFKTDIPTTLLRTQKSITAHVEEADVTPRQHSLQFKQQFDVLFGKPTEIVGFQHKPKVNVKVPAKAQAY